MKNRRYKGCRSEPPRFVKNNAGKRERTERRRINEKIGGGRGELSRGKISKDKLPSQEAPLKRPHKEGG